MTDEEKLCQMYAPEVFVFWSYTKIPIRDFLSFSSVNKRLYAVSNRMIKEVNVFRKLKRSDRSITKTKMFERIGGWCSLYMAKQLLGQAVICGYTPESFWSFRPFMENPNLGLQYVNASPSDVVRYYLYYKKCPDDFRDAPFIEACQNLENSELNWKYIHNKRVLAYCLSNFPEHTAAIVAGVLTSRYFRPSFLRVIDNYKDGLYTPLQKKHAIRAPKRLRADQFPPPPLLFGEEAAEVIQQEIDKANDITRFLLKRNKCN